MRHDRHGDDGNWVHHAIELGIWFSWTNGYSTNSDAHAVLRRLKIPYTTYYSRCSPMTFKNMIGTRLLTGTRTRNTHCNRAYPATVSLPWIWSSSGIFAEVPSHGLEVLKCKTPTERAWLAQIRFPQEKIAYKDWNESAEPSGNKMQNSQEWIHKIMQNLRV